MRYNIIADESIAADQYAGYKWLGRKCLPPTSMRDIKDWVVSFIPCVVRGIFFYTGEGAWQIL